jgi:hypothetical protein
MTSEELLHRFPRRGWRIEISVPFNAEGEDEPVTFRAHWLRGELGNEDHETLSFDAAVSWLADKLRIKESNHD